MNLIKTLEKLVSFKTVTYDNVENERALRWIESQLKGLPVFVKRFYFKNIELQRGVDFIFYIW